MALRLRRGTSTVLGTITLAEGELVYTTDTKRLYVGDGATVGGISTNSGYTGSRGFLGYTGSAGVGFTGSTGAGYTGSAGVGFTGSAATGYTGSAGSSSSLINSSKTASLGSTGILTVPGSIIPDANIAYDLGSATNRFRDIYLSSSTINLGGTAVSVNSSGQLSVSESYVNSFPGNVIGAFWRQTNEFSVTVSLALAAKFDSLKVGDTITLLTGAAPANTVLTLTGPATSKTLAQGDLYYDYIIPVNSNPSTFSYFVNTFTITRDTGSTVSSLVNGARTLSLGTNGNLTLPGGSQLVDTPTGVQISGAGQTAVNRFYTKLSDTLYEAVDAGVTYRLINQAGTWSLDVVGQDNPRYTSTNLITWVNAGGGLPAPTGTLITGSANITVNSKTWAFSTTGNTTFPTGLVLGAPRGVNTVNFTCAVDKEFQIETGTATTGRLWSFSTTGNTTFPSGLLFHRLSSSYSNITADLDKVLQIATQTSGGRKEWTFGTNGGLTLPIGVSIDNNVDPLYPKIIADSGKLFSVQGQGTSGSAALSWTVNPAAAGQYAAVAVSRAGGDNLAKVVIQAQSNSGDVGTAKTWKFDETGNLTFPNNTVQTTAWTGTFPAPANGDSTSGNANLVFYDGAWKNTSRLTISPATSMLTINGDNGVGGITLPRGGIIKSSLQNELTMTVIPGTGSNSSGNLGHGVDQSPAGQWSDNTTYPTGTLCRLTLVGATGDWIQYNNVTLYTRNNNGTNIVLCPNSTLTNSIDVVTGTFASGTLTLLSDSVAIESNSSTWNFGKDGILKLPRNGELRPSTAAYDAALAGWESIRGGYITTTISNNLATALGWPMVNWYPTGPTAQGYIDFLLNAINLQNTAGSTLIIQPAMSLVFYTEMRAALIAIRDSYNVNTTAVSLSSAYGKSWTFGTDGKLTAPGNLQVDGGKIILNTGGNAYVESVDYGVNSANSAVNIFGGPYQKIKLRAGFGTQATWTLGTDGRLTFPDGTNQTTAYTSVYAQSGATSAYATQRVLQYNPSTNAVTYSNYIDASSIYITGYAIEIHVSPSALNNDGNGTIGTPVKTIARAKELLAQAFETTSAGQRKTIILHPGSYTEDVTIDTQFTVLTTHELVGKNTTISGTLTLTKGCTIDGLKMNNLVISADNTTGSVDIIGCTVTTAVTKTSSAYTVFRGCDLSSSTLSVTGTGSTVLVGGNYFTLTVNNAAAGVLSKGVVSMGPVTLTAGTLQLSDTLIYSATNTSYAITQSAGSVITINNCQTLIPDLSNVSRNSLSGFYSILSSVYDRPNSILATLSATGGPLNSIIYNQYVNADRFILNGSTSGTTIINATAVAGSTTLTLPATTDTLVGRTTTDTLTNKTLTSPTINTSVIAGGASIDLLNTTATTVNAFGAATTALNIGASGAPITGFAATATTSSTAASLGYLGLPQSATATTATLTIGDAGKHIYVKLAGQTITIPDNSVVPYPIGTTITFIVGSLGPLTIANNDTMRLAGGELTGTRTLAANGMATAVKVASSTWYINGVGLT